MSLSTISWKDGCFAYWWWIKLATWTSTVNTCGYVFLYSHDHHDEEEGMGHYDHERIEYFFCKREGTIGLSWASCHRMCECGREGGNLVGIFESFK